MKKSKKTAARFATGGPDEFTQEFNGNCAHGAAKNDRRWKPNGIWDKVKDGIGKGGAALVEQSATGGSNERKFPGKNNYKMI